MSGVERAEQAVTEAREALIGFALAALPNEPGHAKAEQLTDNLVRAVRELVACQIETAGGPAPWGLPVGAQNGAWIDSRDSVKAARIAREGLTGDAVNFLLHQLVTGPLPPGPHFVHCYIYEGEHCSCGGNYQGDQPGPDIADLIHPETKEQP